MRINSLAYPVARALPTFSGGRERAFVVVKNGRQCKMSESQLERELQKSPPPGGDDRDTLLKAAKRLFRRTKWQMKIRGWI